MAATKGSRPPADSRPKPALSRLAAACRAVLGYTKPALDPVGRPRPVKPAGAGKTLQALCLSALTLPGMLPQALADDNGNPGGEMSSHGGMNMGNHEGMDMGNHGVMNMDSPGDIERTGGGAGGANDLDSDEEVGYQFSHYEEGNRAIWTGVVNSNSVSIGAHGNRITTNTQTTSLQQIQNQYQPITVDSEHGYGRFRIGDRVRFAFNFVQDVWSGASPVTTAFAATGQNTPITVNKTIVGASPQVQTSGVTYFNAQGKAEFISSTSSEAGPGLHNGGQTVNLGATLTPTSRLQQTLAYASPEMRNQADFRLGYDWDNAALDGGGGMSVERDYQSSFGNLAGRMDFLQKLLTLNLGLSYTESRIHAENLPFLNYGDYQASQLSVPSGGIGSDFLNGYRQDFAFTKSLSMVLNKNAVLSAGFGYTRSWGYLANPYKGVTLYQYDPNSAAYPGVTATEAFTFAEKRPNLRNQFTWDASYRHYIEPLNAAGQLRYSFFHDDWGVNAHTFEGEWRQDLGGNWTVTPSVRYYSQTAASFYMPYGFVSGIDSSSVQQPQLYGMNASSDQRLSAYGALSGGITLSKQVVPGLSVEVGAEYYTHASSLKLGGGGSGDYLDYHYYVANASIRANIAKLAAVGGGFDSAAGGPLDWLGDLFDGAAADGEGMEHMHHAGHRHGRAAAPAGVMFSHMMDEAGEFMAGYRFMRSTQSGNLMQGNQNVISQTAASAKGLGCYTSANKSASCGMYPGDMTMDMHMLDLMYAPTSWLTLMLMPQFVSMDMDMQMPTNTKMATGMGSGSAQRSWQSNGGFGDTSGYVLLRLWDGYGQHLHLTNGISAPTGSINIKSELPKNGLLLPYDMQLGSGTWDYKPSLTYTGVAGDVFWGGQIAGIKRLQGQNGQGYSLGDVFQGTAWAGYQMAHWLSGTVRGLYTEQGAVKVSSPNALGCGSLLNNTNMSDCFPQNYGGSFVDVGVGVTWTPGGRFAGNALSVEWLQPMYTWYNGYQVERTGTLSATWNYGF